MVGHSFVEGPCTLVSWVGVVPCKRVSVAPDMSFWAGHTTGQVWAYGPRELVAGCPKYKSILEGRDEVVARI